MEYLVNNLDHLIYLFRKLFFKYSFKVHNLISFRLYILWNLGVVSFIRIISWFYLLCFGNLFSNFSLKSFLYWWYCYRILAIRSVSYSVFSYFSKMVLSFRNCFRIAAMVCRSRRLCPFFFCRRIPVSKVFVISLCLYSSFFYLIEY